MDIVGKDPLEARVGNFIEIGKYIDFPSHLPVPWTQRKAGTQASSMSSDNTEEGGRRGGSTVGVVLVTLVTVEVASIPVTVISILLAVGSSRLLRLAPLVLIKGGSSGFSSPYDNFNDFWRRSPDHEFYFPMII